KPASVFLEPSVGGEGNSFLQPSLNYFNVPDVKKPDASAATPENCGQPFLCPLSRVRAGVDVRIRKLSTSPELTHRLREMGLLVGTSIQLVRFAPMGDPVEIKVRGYHLTLRRHEAEKIFVRLAEPSATVSS